MYRYDVACKIISQIVVLKENYYFNNKESPYNKGGFFFLQFSYILSWGFGEEILTVKSLQKK